MTICFDFDGTVVTHDYPKIGNPVPKALIVLRKIRSAGHDLVLDTMRSGDELDEAINYLNQAGIQLQGINTAKDQGKWTSTTKTYGDIYINDRNLGTKLQRAEGLSGKYTPVVDWEWVEQELKNIGVL